MSRSVLYEQPELWVVTMCAKQFRMSPVLFIQPDRLVGLVVKESALRAEDPGFESSLRWDFSGVESYQ